MIGGTVLLLVLLAAAYLYGVRVGLRAHKKRAAEYVQQGRDEAALWLLQNGV